ncbi:tape measure protein [Colwellia sp. 6_MG-2023]|uniref:tape measure protein n=1 Tax=Colwellia sp. 6_MG-2023 TaxID=3062676 RepID=UPI0026E38202|nr:tape measure protein [Colwellia sp. 6_MG-2023]MDO6488228.1 tape measure protein [Colwellia sp. 6_MG-2023]
MTDLKLGIVFDVKNGTFKSEVKNSAQVIEQLGASNQQAANKTRQFNTAIDETNTKLFTTNKVASGVKNAIAGLAAGFGAIQLGKGLVTELAAFQDIRTRLQGLSVDAAEYANKERWLIDLSAEHHKELNGLADGYSRLSTLTQEKIITDGQARDMLEGLSDAASRNGASNADLERVYYGLSQALGAGTVNMEDFKQVTEPLPDLMAKIAKAAGHETSSGLKTLIGTGTYTSEVFGKHLVEALQGYAGASAETADNINAKYRDIKREYQLLAVELEQPIESALLPTLDGLAQGLSFLKEHTEAVIAVLQGALVIAAGHATNAIITKTAATAKELIASRASAIAAKTQAQSEYNLALAYKASAVGSVQNEIADKRLIATRTTLTAATAKLSVANKTLGLMSGIVGGLPGLLTIAGFAMYSFATSTGDAADEAKRLNEENNKLNPFANYTFETATGALQRYKGQLELAQQMADETQTRFKNPFFKNVTAGDVTEANKEVERLTKTIEALQTIVNDKSPEKKKPEAPVTQSGKVLDVFKGQEDALNRQLALLGQTTELAKAEYETQQGKYKDLLPGQKATIINLATEIDKKKASIDADKQAVQQAERLSDAASSYAETLQRKISITDEATNVQQLNYELEHGSLVGINEQLKEQLLIKAQLADQAVANAEQQLPFWEQMQEHIGSTSEQFDVMWGNTFDRFAQGIGETTASAIIEGENFSDSMKAMTRGAIQSVLAGLVEIGVKKLTLAAIDKVTAKATAASAGGVMIAQSQAMALMSGLNAFSSTAAIPIVGPVAAPGAMAAALAVTEPMAATIGGLSSGMIGMAHEGIDSIPKEGTWLLDKGERVVDSRTNADLKNYLGNTQTTSQSDVTVQFNVTATDTGGFNQWYRANRNMIISDVSDAVRSPA